MRNFIFAKGTSATTADHVSLVNINPSTGVYEAASTQNVKTNKGLALRLKRDADKGGDVIFPLGTKNVSWVKMQFAAAKAFEGTVDLKNIEVEEGLDYTVILVKLGQEFNYRNKWTATVRATKADAAEGSVAIATKVRKYFADNAASIGITVSDLDGSAFTITSAVPSVNYVIKFADELSSMPTVADSNFAVGLGTPEMVADMANKAAADAGFEYTFQDVVNELYPEYPFEKAVTKFAEDCDVYTIRCAELRDVKTVDTGVNQIIQVAVPKNVAFAEVTDVLDKLK